MRTTSIQNNACTGRTVSFKSNQNKMQINTNHTLLNSKLNRNSMASPSFGWFIIDDLFYYFNRKLNTSREREKSKQIQETNKKVVDDIYLLSQKLNISPAAAKEKYKKYMELGSIPAKGNGYEWGLNRVIGYSKEKLDLIKDVVAPIVAKQKDLDRGTNYSEGLTVPNGVLLYGPRGRGKSYMTECLKEHIDRKSYEFGDHYGFPEIKTFEIDGNWANGDTDENVKRIENTFEEARKYNRDRKAQSVIFINNLNTLLDEDNNPALCATFLANAANCSREGITWVGNITSPKDHSDWFFNPMVTNVFVPVRTMSEIETSALMSYFWAQRDRKDDSDHNRILNYLRENLISLYPPDFERISKNVDRALEIYDYKSEKRGNYKRPVTTNDVIKEIEKFKEKEKQRSISEKYFLDDITDEEYISRKQGKFENADK